MCDGRVDVFDSDLEDIWQKLFEDGAWLACYGQQDVEESMGGGVEREKVVLLVKLGLKWGFYFGNFYGLNWG